MEDVCSSEVKVEGVRRPPRLGRKNIRHKK